MRLIILLFSSVFISIYSVSFIDKLILGNPEQDCFESSAWDNYQVSDKIPSNFKNFLNKTIFIVPELKRQLDYERYKEQFEKLDLHSKTDFKNILMLNQ